MNKLLFFVILILSFSTPFVHGQESVEPPPPEINEPSQSPPEAEVGDASDQEARFARIYQKYNSREMGDEKWAEIAGSKASESYNLQTGDNLWDISTKLFGNGFYWPKVWQLNDNITNPHLVEVGKTLKFTPGSSSSPPSLGVEQNVDQTIASAVTSSDSTEEFTNDPEFDTVVTQDAPEGNQVVIPPGKRSRAVLRNIPPSFPDTSIPIGDYDRKTGFSKEGLKRAKNRLHPSPIPSIVVEKKWDADGKVIEMEGDSTVASTYQNVILKLSEPANRGDLFTAFSSNGKVTDPTTNYSVGIELETRASMEILESVEGAGENTYRARIMYTALPVRLGDSVKAGDKIIRSTFESIGPMSAVAARIINGESNKRYVFGLHNIVYLDKGDEDGLHDGDILNVVKNISTRNPDTVLDFDPRPIGQLKVVEVEPHVATAVVVEEIDGISPGDMTQVVSEESSRTKKSADEIAPATDKIEKEEN